MSGETGGTPGGELSTASKFSMFSRPNERVFIWDTLATSAATHCAIDQRLLEGRNGLNYYNGRYGKHRQICIKALEMELQTRDFPIALNMFVDFAVNSGGPAAEISRDFLARRLFDKLLYWEGRVIEATRREEIINFLNR
jgi:hypothetical protein